MIVLTNSFKPPPSRYVRAHLTDSDVREIWILQILFGRIKKGGGRRNIEKRRKRKEKRKKIRYTQCFQFLLVRVILDHLEKILWTVFFLGNHQGLIFILTNECPLAFS